MTDACAMGFCLAGNLGQADALMQRAFFLNPFPPSDFHADYALLLALRGEHEAAEEHFAVSGETWLLYLAIRIANAGYLDGGAERVAAVVARFTADFLRIWQPQRTPAAADVLEWMGYSLPLNQPQHSEWLNQGLWRMLEPTWPAADGSSS
jgi:hypothetical protein